MSQQTTEQSSPTLLSDPLGFFTGTYQGLGLLLVGMLLAMLLMGKGGRNDSLADARFANGKEKQAARKFGIEQRESQIHNECAFSIGSDRQLILPDAQRSTGVSGGSGSGKTASMIDPMIDDAIRQGWTGLVYDVKGLLMKRHMAQAIKEGYDVYIYAPGIKNAQGQYISDGLNFLRFMENEYDSGMADEIAHVLRLNLEPGDGSRRDPFFGPAGDALLSAIFQLAKAKNSVYNDFAMAWEFMRLMKLEDRITDNRERQLLDYWIASAFASVESAKAADETVAGIISGGVTALGPLIKPHLIPLHINSTIPVDLPGKQIVFCQIDEEREASTAPLVAVFIHMMLTRNLNSSVKRDRPFFVCLDEFPTLRLPSIERFINLKREYGQVLVLGYQLDSQLRMRYSRDYADSIIGSCGNKAIFSPGVGNTHEAERWSKSLGEKEVKTRGRTWNSGKSSGSSRSENPNKKPLMTPQEVEFMQPGECLIFSPRYKRPFRTQIKLNKRDQKQRKKSVQLWSSTIESQFVKRSVYSGTNKDVLEQEMKARQAMANLVLAPLALLQAEDQEVQERPSESTPNADQQLLEGKSDEEVIDVEPQETQEALVNAEV